MLTTVFKGTHEVLKKTNTLKSDRHMNRQTDGRPKTLQCRKIDR